MQQPLTAERRRAPRIPVKVEAKVWREIGWRQAKCESVSKFGLGLHATHAVNVGDRLAVTLELPDAPSVTLPMTVVSSDNGKLPRLGLEIIPGTRFGFQYELFLQRLDFSAGL